jgi:hypothetical protein
VSGGPPYGMRLLDACADGLFRAETGLPFVEYLNWVFRSAGFPYCTGGSTKEWEVTFWAAKTSRIWPPGFGLPAKDRQRCPPNGLPTWPPGRCLPTISPSRVRVSGDRSPIDLIEVV